jgi:hypothetical protein
MSDDQRARCHLHGMTTRVTGAAMVNDQTVVVVGGPTQ